MVFVTVVSTVVCALIAAAHFFRAWSFDAQWGYQGWSVVDLAMVGLSLAGPFFLLVRTRRAMRLVQMLLVLGSAVMVWKGVEIVRERMAEENPRVVPPMVIMGGVGVFFLIVAAMFQTRWLKARYPKQG